MCPLAFQGSGSVVIYTRHNKYVAPPFSGDPFLGHDPAIKVTWVDPRGVHRDSRIPLQDGNPKCFQLLTLNLITFQSLPPYLFSLTKKMLWDDLQLTVY